MALHLAQFVAEMKADIEAFEQDYREQHAANPDQFPLELDSDNTGLWFEFFEDFINRRSDADE